MKAGTGPQCVLSGTAAEQLRRVERRWGEGYCEGLQRPSSGGVGKLGSLEFRLGEGKGDLGRDNYHAPTPRVRHCGSNCPEALTSSSSSMRAEL